MNIEHIFEPSFIIGRILGWAVFVYSLWSLCYVLPYLYDAYIINKPWPVFDQNDAQRKRWDKAAENLSGFQDVLSNLGCSPPTILNRFWGECKKRTLIWSIAMILGIFMPTVLKVVGAIILFSL